MGEEFKKTEPGMSVALEDILDRELGRTLAGKARIDECCAPHPEIAGDLKPLLELALASREALRVEVTAETRAAAREKLMARRQHPSGAGSGRSPFNPATTGVGSRSVGDPLGGNSVRRQQRRAGQHPLSSEAETRRRACFSGGPETGPGTGRSQPRQCPPRRAGKIVGEDKPQFIADLLARYETEISEAVTLTKAAADGEDTSGVEAAIQATRDRAADLVVSLEQTAPADAANALIETESKAGAICTESTSPSPSGEGDHPENGSSSSSGEGVHDSGQSGGEQQSGGGGDGDSGDQSPSSWSSGESSGHDSRQPSEEPHSEAPKNEQNHAGEESHPIPSSKSGE